MNAIYRWFSFFKHDCDQQCPSGHDLLLSMLFSGACVRWHRKISLCSGDLCQVLIYASLRVAY